MNKFILIPGVTVDNLLAKEIEGENVYWKEVLRRAVSVIKFLAERGLAFRGENETPKSPSNGNYLGILELLSEFDPFLAKHIEARGYRGRGYQHYLSSTICDELILLMGDRVLASILSDLRRAKYYSISVDSTPDLSHTDQLTFVTRFVGDDGPVERFLAFIPVESKTGENLAAVITSFLANNEISIGDCRGQSYDNASNMTGPYSGVQSRILALNTLAYFIPCADHSLNLVGENAANCNDVASKVFGFIQELYNFLSSSTSRWAVMQQSLSDEGTKTALVPKSQSQTRWSARYDAVRALLINYKAIELALQRIVADTQRFDRQTRFAASNFAKHFEDIETALMIVVWSTLLERFNANSRMMQKATIDLGTVVNCYKSLIEFTQDMRSRFDEFEKRAMSLLGVDQPSYREDSQRRRGQSVTMDTRLSRDKYVAAFDEILLCVISELNRRLSSYIILRCMMCFSFCLTFPI